MNFNSFWLGLSTAAIAMVLTSQFSFFSSATADEKTSEAKTEPSEWLYELRTYYTPEGKLDDLHARFRNHTMSLFEKHGMKNIMYWTPVDKPNTLIYVLAHKDKAAAEKSWAAFRSDPEWMKARDESEKNGKLVDKVESVFMKTTDYTPKHH
ncbi:MAG: NIPSNAP family protein [Planctomycetota bacterium]